MEISDFLWRKLHIFEIPTKSKFLGAWHCHAPTDISQTRDNFFSVLAFVFISNSTNLLLKLNTLLQINHSDKIGITLN